MRACIGCGTEIPYTAPLTKKRCKKNCGSGSKNSARASARERHEMRFVGVDGEGVTYCGSCGAFKEDSVTCKCGTIDWQHDYVLLTVGDREPLFNPDGSHLSWESVLSYLYECFESNPTAAYVGFFLGYDFTQWVRTLPQSRAASLLTPDGIAARARKQSGKNKRPFPVHIGSERFPWQWEIDTLAMKRFSIRPGTGHPPGEVKNPHRAMVICDAGPFFQKSFLSVIESHIDGLITQEEFDLVKEGKERRSVARLDADMQRYNALENDILSRIMGQLNEGFTDIGIRLRTDQWYGPGQAAQQWLNNIRAPLAEDLRETVPEWAFDTARQTYYGGWFEIYRHGIIPGTTYEYDINSAYPYAIAELPCLEHGEWSRGTGVSNTDSLSEESFRMLHAHVRGSDSVSGTLPHRTRHGRVLRPRETRGWYWEHEIIEGVIAGIIDEVAVDEWVQYDPCDCPKPFRGIADLYQKRLKVGKNTPSGVAYKLVYNSAYGKMAQSVGKPKFANSIYASLITSLCRTRILTAIATHPRKTTALLMVATDGVYFDSPHPDLEIDSQKLGAWDESTKENLCLFMPGVYWDDKSRKALREGKEVRVKSRGISAKDLSMCIEGIDEQFKRMRPGDEWPSMKVPILFNMTSAKLALARGKWETAGAITLDGVKEIKASPHTKRASVVHSKDGILYTQPYDVCESLDTTPYDKKFGQEMSDFQLSDIELTPDGTLNLMHLLNG